MRLRKSGRGLAALQDASRVSGMHEYPPGFGVRPVLCRFGFLIMNGSRLVTALLLGWSFYAPAGEAATVNIFAASSLTDSLKEIATTYEHKTGDKIVFNFGASSLLARQIEEGAPADLFF